jgi:hypothetical protein
MSLDQLIDAVHEPPVDNTTQAPPILRAKNKKPNDPLGGRKKPEKALGTEIPASPLTIADGIDFRHWLTMSVVGGKADSRPTSRKRRDWPGAKLADGPPVLWMGLWARPHDVVSAFTGMVN